MNKVGNSFTEDKDGKVVVDLAQSKSGFSVE